MNRAMLLALPLLAACGDGNAPARFDVDVRVETSTVGTGCLRSWTARASDPTVPVTFKIGDFANWPDSVSWFTSGQFSDELTSSVVYGATTNVNTRWQVSAPGFYEDKWVSVGCGSTWQEP